MPLTVFVGFIASRFFPRTATAEPTQEIPAFKHITHLINEFAFRVNGQPVGTFGVGDNGLPSMA